MCADGAAAKGGADCAGVECARVNEGAEGALIVRGRSTLSNTRTIQTSPQAKTRARGSQRQSPIGTVRADRATRGASCQCRCEAARDAEGSRMHADWPPLQWSRAVPRAAARSLLRCAGRSYALGKALMTGLTARRICRHACEPAVEKRRCRASRVSRIDASNSSGMASEGSLA